VYNFPVLSQLILLLHWILVTINDFLSGLFLGAGIKLVDFKLEFGRLWENDYMRIVLADEISPDNCRLWDVTTNEKLDKDRFRRDMGGLVDLGPNELIHPHLAKAFDGQLDAVKQRAAIDNMASQKWDFVAIQAFGIGTLTQPVNKMIDAGIPVIDMDTLIAPLDQIKVHSFLAPDNEFMGASVTQALCNAIGGKGKIIMTQGALGHTGAQGRAKGFESVVKQFPNIEVLDTQPADWDVSKAARLWETYLTKYPQIDAAFFHNDDMALAAANIMKARNRTNILIGGVDAMPPAIQAVSEGRMFATVRNPSCRIHGGAIVAGVAAVTAGEKSGQGIPKHVITDGPVVTKANAAGMQWMEDHFLI